MSKKSVEEKKETIVKSVAETKSMVETKGKTDQILVYTGPTIKGIAVQYSQFIHGIPKRLLEYAEENRDVKRLIVPVDKFLEAKKNINIQGSIENISYNNILNQKGE